MECLDDLISVKNLCTEEVSPLFWMDDIEGMDLDSLSELAAPINGSGKKYFTDLRDAASRFLITDIETLIPKGYTIKSSLNSFCNICTYTGLSSSQQKTGVIVKKITISKNAYLSIDSLKVMIASSGTYNIVLDDGIDPRMIEHEFTSGTEVIITNINYKTTASSIKIYINEPGVNVTALNCPKTKSCGCSGSQQNRDITIKGLLNNTEYTAQYGFIPCASIVCSLDNVICQIINYQPRLFGLALLYKSAAMFFGEYGITKRNNQNASFNKEEKLALADRFAALYYERLNGSSNVKGISDNMAAVLNNLKDPCIECSRTVTSSWAVG
jgi:hypothetical protein